MTSTILVIDDSEDDQHLYLRAFKDYDCFFNLVMTSSAQAGLARAIAQKPDLILLDYNLPDMDGLSFMKKLDAHSVTPIPIIMLTGESSAAVAVEVMKQGADDYLVKDTEGRYLRLLPGVAGRVMATFAHRKEAQRLRQQTEALLLRNQALMQSSMDGICVTDMAGNVVEVNSAFCRMLGYTPEEMASFNVADWDAQWSAEELQERFNNHFVNQPWFETVHRRKDGTLLNVEISTSNMEIDGQCFIVATIHDFTERKCSENKLRESEARLKALFENLRSGVAVYRASPDGQDFFFTSFNPAAERIEHLCREDLMGKNVLEVFPRVVEFGLLEVLRRVWRSGVEERFPVTSYRDGRLEGWREYYVYKLPNAEVVAIYDDITREKQAEEELLQERAAERKQAEELAQQFGHLLQSSFNEIYMFDAESLKFILTSEGAEKNLGYSEDELNQLTPLDLKPSHSRESFEALIAPLRSGAQQQLIFESVHRRKDSTTYPIEGRLQLMGGDFPVFLAIVQDTTERIVAENQAREYSAHLQTVREEEKASFAREVHDDLGGTMAALKMDAYWLAGKLAKNEEMRPMQACAQSMTGLLDNAILSIRRIITDLRPTILDELGLVAALKWQCAEFQKRNSIECQCASMENENLQDSLDKLQLINLFRIAQEALTNVARHSGASKVVVDLHHDGEKITLTIIDNGHGLPQGHIIAATSYGMRGMRERVSQLGGQIKFNTPPGGGFSLTVKLPLLNGGVKS